MEESPEEKYLGDMIHTDGTGVSILSTTKKYIAQCITKLNVIIYLAENPHMAGMRNSRYARNLFKTEVVTSILNNSESWIGITTEFIDMMQDFKNRFMLRFFKAPKKGHTNRHNGSGCKYAIYEKSHNAKTKLHVQENSWLIQTKITSADDE